MEYWGIDWTPENATEYLSDFSLWMLFWNIVRRRDWQPDNDGAYACKAQALFIKRHGKEKFFNVHDRLHGVYDFKKTQEVLGRSVEEGLKILEVNM